MQAIQRNPSAQVDTQPPTDSIRHIPHNQDGVSRVAVLGDQLPEEGILHRSVPSQLGSYELSSNFVQRLRGKHGPEARIFPMDESPITQAIRTAVSRNEEHVFLPAVRMEFNSFKEAKDFYNLYSWEIGFGIRKGRNKVNQNNYTTRQDLVCSCEGICPNKHAATIRTGCKAMIRLHRTGDHGWVISSFVVGHNHPCSSTYGQNKQWLSHSDIDPMTIDIVKKLRENNISFGRVCNILGVTSTQSCLPLRKEAVRSLCARIAQENIKDDIGKTVSLLESMKQNDLAMETCIKVDVDGRIKSMLWSTGKNRGDYAKFGDVVTFDTTYRTNLYNMPFGLFVGVNNHFQSIVFGGVLLTNEKIEDFEWAFGKFLEIMGGKQPQTILTDQCQAMAAAIKSTFKGCNHRWCRWHVLRKTKQKVGPIYSKKSNFKKEFNKLVTEEILISRFERKWRQLLRKYNLNDNSFLQRLFKYRAKWAKPYFMGIFCAGMTSTQRSESANHMLKQFIQRSAPMHMFVKKFNEFQMDRNQQEDKEVHLTKQMRRKRRVGVPIERHAETIYSRAMYDKFYNELYYSGGYAIKTRNEDVSFEVAHSSLDGKPEQVLYKVEYVPGDRITCQCGLFEHLGMICRHSLKVLVHLDVKEIPKNNILTRWMKNFEEPCEYSICKAGVGALLGSNDVLKKRALVSRVIQVANGTDPINEEVFVQVMTAMDTVLSHSKNQDNSFTSTPIPLRCPDRPAKKGRPPNSSLNSWKEEQKRKKCHSTDEENPRGGKTRKINDVLGI